MATKPVWVDKFEDLEIVSFPFRIGNIANTIFFGLIFSYLLGVVRTVGPGAGAFRIFSSALQNFQRGTADQSMGNAGAETAG
ncbi:MAG: hypothetical protein CMQ19_04460 [Gammaproteobacteria bacterium]|nr:hypothetical protein [Gammaproteobacteria bacterium]